MADDKQSGSGLGGSSIVLLLAAVASAVYMGWRAPPLISVRPTEPASQISRAADMQDIEARLWQDPLTAVMQGRQDARSDNRDPDIGHCLSDFHKLIDTGSQQTFVIGVDLPGDPYPEAAETRRRLRYAMLSALHTAQYVPTDEQHIAYLRTGAAPTSPGMEADRSGAFRITGLPIAGPTGRDALTAGVFQLMANDTDACRASAAEGGDSLVPAIVPFERFQLGPYDPEDKQYTIEEYKNTPKRIIVLWLDEEVLAHSQRPIASLTSLLCKLKLPASARFALLGPQESDVLEAMIQELERSDQTKISNPVKESCASVPVPVYNFGATAENEIILQHAGVDKSDIERLKDGVDRTDLATIYLKNMFKDAGIDYYRTISSDKELAEMLKQELLLRGVDLSGNDPTNYDRVFLLSEWDTDYGRYLPHTMSQILGADESSFGGCRLHTSRRIMHASYLRGLDGRLPGRRQARKVKPSENAGGDQASADQTEGEEAIATPDTASRFESAEGQSQFDYLRRITDALKECDKRLRLKGAGKIAAIGVLGSDVYDKLLLLQALRPVFSEAIFFTTDLDELLLPQDKRRYTRDLLVASGYGLTLNLDLQKDILPFRSSYQTSIFLAARLAIRNDERAAEYAPVNTALNKDSTSDPKGDPWSETTESLGCWTKQPQLFQIGRTAARDLPAGPVPAACNEVRNTRDFAGDQSIAPEAPKLYPEFRYRSRVGTFLIPIVLLAVLFVLPPIRKVFKYRVALAEASGPPAGQPASPVAPSWVWLIPLLVTVLTIWALVTLRWPNVARWLTEYPDANAAASGYPSGDPMSLLEGISIWPSIALRCIGSILSFFLIWWTLRLLEINRRETANEMGAPDLRKSVAEEFWEVWNDPTLPQLAISGLWARLCSLFWFRPRFSYPQPLDFDSAGRAKVPFRDIVFGFSLRWWVRCVRAGIVTVFMMLVVWSWILVPIFGSPDFVPARGPRAREIYILVTVFDVIPTLFLIFLVADANLHSRKFITRLTEISTIWPNYTLRKFRNLYPVPDDALADWLDLKYLAERTRSVTQLIYFPFLSLTVMILARSHLFDNFATPWTLPAAQGISIAFVVGSVIAYRSAAEKARDAAREHLTAKVIAAQAVPQRAAQLQMMLDQIASLKEGAFAPPMSQPVVKAVLVPLVTYGATWIAHIYGLPGA